MKNARDPYSAEVLLSEAKASSVQGAARARERLRAEASASAAQANSPSHDAHSIALAAYGSTAGSAAGTRPRAASARAAFGDYAGICTSQAMSYNRTRSTSPSKAHAQLPPRPATSRPRSNAPSTQHPSRPASARPASSQPIRQLTTEPSVRTLSTNLFRQDARFYSLAPSQKPVSWQHGNLGGTGLLLGPTYPLLNPEGPVDVPNRKVRTLYPPLNRS